VGYQNDGGFSALKSGQGFAVASCAIAASTTHNDFRSDFFSETGSLICLGKSVRSPMSRLVTQEIDARSHLPEKMGVLPVLCRAELPQISPEILRLKRRGTWRRVTPFPG